MKVGSTVGRFAMVRKWVAVPRAGRQRCSGRCEVEESGSHLGGPAGPRRPVG
jgi:hypothetical protein